MKNEVMNARIEKRIFVMRGERVLLDADLAALYGVSTKALNQAVKRNQRRFPTGFMFRLTRVEKREVVTNCDHLRHLKYSHVLPYAFTEHGAVMLASVLNTSRAIQVSLVVVKVFVRFKNEFSVYKELLTKIHGLEKRVEGQGMNIRMVFKTLRALMHEAAEPERPKRQMGFHVDLKTGSQ